MSKVFLVGTGPGAADLLTVRAARVLASADVILYDALVGQDVLGLMKSTAKLVNVGKRCGCEQFEQQEINSLLVHFARQPGVVVRVKGGDPLIFGRAAEEMDALRNAGIDFEVIPGVTAACAAAASAKTSLTDRRTASSVVITTAHLAKGRADGGLTETGPADQTYAVYMPGRDYTDVQGMLRARGMAEGTPCLVVSRISTPQEKLFATTIHDLGNAPQLPAPSILIVGEVVRPNLIGAAVPLPAIDSEIPEPSIERRPL